MITPIQCATMHSGLTEQEVKEKYDWVLRALSEYGSRCVYDFLDGNSPEPAKHKPFIVGNVRDILDELKQEEITFGLFVEKLNAIARKFYEKPSEGASEGMAEALRLLDTASNLVGNPGTNISSSTDFACDSWQEKYKQFLASLSPGVEDGSGWVKVEDGLPEMVEGWSRVEYMTIIKGYTGVWVGKIFKSSFGYSCTAKTSHDIITHWRPLPTPPGVEDNQTKKQ